MSIAIVMVLIYSPVGPYFNGFTFEVRQDQAACLAEVQTRIGEPVPWNWVPQMQGPVPKVVGGFCAPGGFSASAFDGKRQ